MVNASGVGGLSVEASDRLGIAGHRLCHHLDGALAAHLDMLTKIDGTHPTFPELLLDVIAIGDDTSHQVGSAYRAERRAVVGTELGVVGPLLAACGTGLHAVSTRSIWSPTKNREPCCSTTSPRTAIATPLRLPASSITKSASSERISACAPLMEGS